MIIKTDSHFLKQTPDLLRMIENFKTSGLLFGNGKRNIIKLFELDGMIINIKSFKKPHLVNRIVYRYFRKSKAQRSYEYAVRLLENGIGTPQPIAYVEISNWFGLRDSYYVSQHFEADLTYRELITNTDYPDYENILRQFAKFTFELHEKGIEFLDHSPGNTLIKKMKDGQYGFYLVDLNRMNFHNLMNFHQRMKNFRRLTPKKEMISLMSEEYSKFYTAKKYQEIFDEMWQETNLFMESFDRKKRLKKKMKFGKS